MANTNAEIIALLQTDPSQAIRGVLDTLYLFNPATVNDLIELLNKVISNHGFLAVVVDKLPETGQNGTVYFVPNGGGAPNSHDEYVWVAEKNAFELIGNTQIDLSDYVKKTDYAGIDKAGLIMASSAFGTSAGSSGYLTSQEYTLSTYNSRLQSKGFISKGTLENIKYDLVKRAVTANDIELTDEEKAAARTWLSAVGTTEYATDGKVGVIKGSGVSGLYCNSSGNLIASTASLSEYTSKPVSYVIGKGTLENVLAQYATAQYVDDQVFDVLDYVSNQTTPIKNNIKQLDTNIRTVADWVNIKDEDGNRATLETEAQDAYRAINELNAKISDIETVADTAKAIAEGKATGYVFDTVDDMNSWLGTNSNILKLGDNLYIRAVNVPDYWWDGEKAQQLETQKVDLDDYVKNTDYATGTVGGVVKVTGNHGLAVYQGMLIGSAKPFDSYSASANNLVMAKGTLENVKNDLVKRAVTENDIELTDEEKTAARTWIGAIGDTDYAGTDGSPGTIKTSSAYGTQMVTSGYIRAGVDTLEAYNTRGVNFFVGKGTLENIKDDYVKRGLTENGIELTDDEKTAARTWLGAIGNTDYAGVGGVAGVIRPQAAYGVTVSPSSGVMYSNTLTLTEYQTVSTACFMSKGTLENIKDDYVKRGITANTITLTDEEKAAAQAWLGVAPNTVAFTETTIELADNTIYNTGETSSLTITFPTTDATFTSQLNFTSGATATAFTAPDTIKWAGDDITENAFVPAANKRYAVMFYSDNVNIRAIVQGVE